MLCPYCKQTLTGAAAVPIMSQRKTRIYDAVVAAGRDGVNKHLLLEIMCGDQKPSKGGQIMLRVQICELNDIISPLKQRIIAKRDVGYFLVAFDAIS